MSTCRMCELLGRFKPLIIIQVPLSLTVVRFKCNLSDNPFAFELTKTNENPQRVKGQEKTDTKI